MEEEKRVTIQVTEQEKRVLEMMRAIAYGEIRILINAEKPVRVEEIRRSVKL